MIWGTLSQKWLQPIKSINVWYIFSALYINRLFCMDRLICKYTVHPMDPNTPSGPFTRRELVDGKSPNKGSHLDALHRSGESRGNVAGSFVFKGLFWGGRNQEPNNRCRVGGCVKKHGVAILWYCCIGGGSSWIRKKRFLKFLRIGFFRR